MKKDLNFIGHSKVFFTISLAIIAIGIICNIIFGTTLDIQFKGGSIVSYNFTGEIDDAALKDAIQDATPEHQVSFTITKDIMNQTEDEQAYSVAIQFSGNDSIDSDTISNITSTLEEKFPENDFQYKENSSIEASMGVKFLLKCLTAVAIASLLMVIYVTLRFSRIGGMSAGIMALVALFHDVAIIYFMYVIFRMPIDSSFIAVILMIIGYSLNDTIVIYDRVREERRLAGPKADIAEVFNHSASRVMSRTIATSVTTLVAIGTVYVVALIFNLASVQAFALPMMIGIISGCYSSLCIAGPLWVAWNKRVGVNRPLGMKWYKFLIYVGLFIYAIGSILETVGCIVLMILRGYSGSLLFYAIVCAFLAILAIVARSNLARNKKSGPIWLYIMLCLGAISNIIYLIIGEHTGRSGAALQYTAIVLVLVDVIFIAANIVYFNNRKNKFT